ncbi:MAG: glutamate formimidoyltransferase [Chloroflexi bacterium]|nr:glutamate formimidoyltransferase [Chloroflexota bacterium]
MGIVIECVPNVSEGRRAHVVDRLAAAIEGVPGVRLLDRTSDHDHHRSVFTFAGAPDAVGEAALALVAGAIPLIDLRSHEGVHPRMGAIDVLPFVPLGDARMEDAVALAHRVGGEIARRHDLPVYFYGRAALTEERRILAAVRRPRFEGLPSVIGSTHRPDAGPSRVHPTAGAIAVGARAPLIAFNVELGTADVAVARRIARRIRESSGGLRAVQAIGLALTSPARAQVSCNLLDHRVTPLAVLYRAIAAAARDEGVALGRSELIGLIPLEAAAQAAGAALGLDLRPDRIIESHLT